MTENTKYQSMLDLFRDASTKIQILPVVTTAVEKLIDHINYNPQSYFGTVITHTGGIVVDQWIRIYGSGQIDLISRNQELSGYGKMIVAEDITGGLFALTAEGTLCYFAPDSLDWEDMEITYGDFLQWITDKERTEQFYETVRFDNWETVVKDIKINQGLGYYPYLWAESDDEELSIKILPIAEIQNLQLEHYNKL